MLEGTSTICPAATTANARDGGPRHSQARRLYRLPDRQRWAPSLPTQGGLADLVVISTSSPPARTPARPGPVERVAWEQPLY